MDSEKIASTSNLTQGEELRRLLRYLAPYTLPLAAGILLMAIMGVAEGLVAFAIKPALDVVLNPQSTLQKLVLFQVPGTARIVYLNAFVPARVHHVWSVFALSLLFIFLVKAIAEYFGSTLIQYVGLAGVTDLRNQRLRQIVQQPIGFFQHNPVGRVMSAVIDDIEQIRSAFSDFLADFFRQIFAWSLSSCVLLIINWRMALGSADSRFLSSSGPSASSARRSAAPRKPAASRLADLSQILQETITGNRVVKAFGMEGFEISRFREAARHLLRENMRWIRAMAATSPIMDVLGAVVIALILLYARDEIKVDRMTMGLFVAFAYRAFQSLRTHETPRQHLSALPSGAGRLFPGFPVPRSCPKKSLEAPGATALPPFSRPVEFENASFAYDDGDSLIFEQHHSEGSRRRRRGHRRAPAAQEKPRSSIFSRASTTPPPARCASTASIVREVTLRSLREQMAIVTQETILFNDTVWNNLCYGRPDLPEEKVVAAAKAALAHDFIMQMPQGLSDASSAIAASAFPAASASAWPSPARCSKTRPS